LITEPGRAGHSRHLDVPMIHARVLIMVLEGKRSGVRNGHPWTRLETSMPIWLILIVVGIILAVVGFGGAGNLLIWLGVIVLVVGLVMTLLNRSRV
jgi:hypothetical protein